MKRCFLRLHFLNELSERFIRQLVSYADHKGAVVIDLLVEFGALVTHSSSALVRIAALIGCPLISSQMVELFTGVHAATVSRAAAPF
jgi:hypothetical protein